MLQDEYYVIRRSNNDNYPLFSWDQLSGDFGMGRPVEFKEPVKFRLGSSASPNFEWVDYHSSPEPVISKRIFDALIPLDLYGVQFVPAKVRNPKAPFSDVKDYWYMHVWNQISCLDKENSELELYDDGAIFEIEKLILNEKILSLFELRKRQIFELTENTSVLLVHQTIKDAIESVNPEGCRFFKATDWYSDIVFEK
ncbi:hypothetical protein MNBD_GAMMA09-162 [hydrothermal vent metagenome]|uniref:Immunity MXAN-0049 protein domain-containing protein n=1 Tax=hydrothermal vent metagenome TaxID=652676 RepID=A0A3B0XWK4_9ZZZZ